MSEQVSAQFRKWMGLDIAKQALKYKRRDINYSSFCVDNGATCPLITYVIAIITIIVESIIIIYTLFISSAWLLAGQSPYFIDVNHFCCAKMELHWFGGNITLF